MQVQRLPVSHTFKCGDVIYRVNGQHSISRYLVVKLIGREAVRVIPFNDQGELLQSTLVLKGELLSDARLDALATKLLRQSDAQGQPSSTSYRASPADKPEVRLAAGQK